MRTEERVSISAFVDPDDHERLVGRLGLSPESAALEGEPDEVDARVRAAHDEKLRPKRLEAARRVRAWREIENDLVPRLGGRWLVSSSSDAIYVPYRGVVWVADSAVAVSDQVELAFTVGDDDQLRFYEHVRQPASWSQYVRRQADKEHLRTASKPTQEWMKP